MSGCGRLVFFAMLLLGVLLGDDGGGGLVSSYSFLSSVPSLLAEGNSSSSRLIFSNASLLSMGFVEGKWKWKTRQREGETNNEYDSRTGSTSSCNIVEKEVDPPYAPEGDVLGLVMEPSALCPSGFAYKSRCVCFTDKVDGGAPYLCDSESSGAPSGSESVGNTTSSPSEGDGETTSAGGGGGDSSSESAAEGPSLTARLVPLLCYVVILTSIGGYMLTRMNRNKEESPVVIISAV